MRLKLSVNGPEVYLYPQFYPSRHVFGIAGAFGTCLTLDQLVGLLNILQRYVSAQQIVYKADPDVYFP
jgi:hypothetical protein